MGYTKWVAHEVTVVTVHALTSPRRLRRYVQDMAAAFVVVPGVPHDVVARVRHDGTSVAAAAARHNDDAKAATLEVLH